MRRRCQARYPSEPGGQSTTCAVTVSLVAHWRLLFSHTGTDPTSLTRPTSQLPTELLRYPSEKRHDGAETSHLYRRPAPLLCPAGLQPVPLSTAITRVSQGSTLNLNRVIQVSQSQPAYHRSRNEWVASTFERSPVTPDTAQYDSLHGDFATQSCCINTTLLAGETVNSQGL